ncbi:MAG: relaxase/mobilization nuclease domain-containing protein [Rhodothermales bacterium]
MIASTSTGKSFSALSAYLEHGKTGEETGRIEWVETRGLFERDLERVAEEMRDTAALSERCQRPCFHLSISFDHGDVPTREEMVAVAEQTLRDIGLDSHQAVIASHNDREHQHVHLMVNRVHPETGRAWEDWQCNTRIEESLRRQERSMGYREVPGHLGRLPDQERPDRTESLTRTAFRKCQRDGVLPFQELVKDVARQDFREARSWGELAERLDRHGLRVEPRGRGLVVTDGHEYAKVSSIDRGSSKHKLEARFGERHVEYRERTTLERSVVGRAAGAAERGRGDGGPAHDHAGAAGDEGRDRAPGGRGDGYGPPAGARAPGDEAVRAQTAMEDLGRGAPDRSAERGADRADAHAAQAGLDADRTPARGHRGGGEHEGAVPGHERGGAGDVPRTDGVAGTGGTPALGSPAVERIVADVHALEKASGIEREIHRTHSALSAAHQSARRHAWAEKQLTESARHFTSKLRKVYQDPEQAHRAFLRAADARGAEKAAQTLREAPERYGALQTAREGLFRQSDREARMVALEAWQSAATYYRARHEVPSAAEKQEVAKALGQTEAKLKSLGTNRDLSADTLERRIGQEMAWLSPKEMRQLERSLSPSGMKLAMGALGMAREVQRGLER